MNALIVVRNTESSISVYLNRIYNYYLWCSCKEKKGLRYYWAPSQPSWNPQWFLGFKITRMLIFTENSQLWIRRYICMLCFK